MLELQISRGVVIESDGRNTCAHGCGGVWCKLELFFSLWFIMPARGAESKHPEAWPANIYGHLREGYLKKRSQIKELANFNLPSVAQDSSI